MARTALTVQSVDADGVAQSLSAANVDGHSVVAGSCSWIEVANASGGSINVTVPSVGTVEGDAVSDRVVAVADGTTQLISMHPDPQQPPDRRHPARRLLVGDVGDRRRVQARLMRRYRMPTGLERPCQPNTRLERNLKAKGGVLIADDEDPDVRPPAEISGDGGGEALPEIEDPVAELLAGTKDEIVALSEEFDYDALTAIIEAETVGKNRSTVLEGLERLKAQRPRPPRPRRRRQGRVTVAYATEAQLATFLGARPPKDARPAPRARLGEGRRRRPHAVRSRRRHRPPPPTPTLRPALRDAARALRSSSGWRSARSTTFTGLAGAGMAVGNLRLDRLPPRARPTSRADPLQRWPPGLRHRMTRIPTHTLRQTATIEPYQGETGEGGATFGEPVTVATRLERREKRVVRPDGVEVVTTGVGFIRPEVTVDIGDNERPPAAEDRYTCSGRTYEIVEVATGQGLTRPTHLELMLVPTSAN